MLTGINLQKLSLSDLGLIHTRENTEILWHCSQKYFEEMMRKESTRFLFNYNLEKNATPFGSSSVYSILYAYKLCPLARRYAHILDVHFFIMRPQQGCGLSEVISFLIQRCIF